MQCLWLTLADPDPATNGQLIYSKGLIDAGCSASTGGWPMSRPSRRGAACCRPCPLSPTAAMLRT
jgi:hypothetical protein